MHDLLRRSFNLNLNIMTIIGLYPAGNRYYYKLYAYTVYMVLIVFISVSGTLYLVFEDISMEEVSNNATMVAQMAVLIFKLLPFLRNEKNIRRCLHRLNKEVFNNYTLTQKTVVDNCIVMSQRILAVFLCFCWASLLGWATKPLFVKERKLPMDILLPFDATATPLRYVGFVYSLHFVAVTNGALANATVDTLIPGLIYHASGQIRILKDNLINMEEYVDDMLEKEMYDRSDRKEMKNLLIYERIRNCTKHHLAVVNYVKDVERCFSSVVFWQFLISMFVICISCYELTLVELLSFPFYAMLIYIITLLSEIFLYCYYGTDLYEESNSLPNAIFLSTWYEYDMKSKKALIILMENSKRPLYVTAGKVLDLSLDTFMTILRRAYSIFAVLKNY